MSRRNSLMVGRTLYQIGVLTLLVAVIWVGFGAYRALSNTKIENVDKSLVEPMTATIDMKVVNQLQSRLKISNEDIPKSDNIEEVIVE